MSEATLYVQAEDENGDVVYVPLAEVDPKRAAREQLFGEVVATFEQLARLGNGDTYGNSIGNCIAIRMLDKIKATTTEEHS